MKIKLEDWNKFLSNLKGAICILAKKRKKKQGRKDSNPVHHMERVGESLILVEKERERELNLLSIH